jgi:penicillin-binding protein 1A
MTHKQTRDRIGMKKRRRINWRVLLILAAFGLGMGIASIAWLARDLPSGTRMQLITHKLKTQVLDCHGEVYGSFGTENRVAISLEEISPHLINAVLSVEDRRFYSHWGVDLLRWPKIIMRDLGILLRDRNAPLHGASTLTMQLARDLFLTKEQTLTRKAKELILTLQLERNYSKDEILIMYLNQIYFGAGSWGVESTSQTIFGKSAAELNIEESAMVAGMAKNPWAYDPQRFPERALKRRNLALRMIADNEMISEAQLDSLKRLPLIAQDRRRGRARSGSYFLEHVRRYLMDRYGADRLYREGLTVETTIDPELQARAEEELERHMIKVEDLMGYEDTHASVTALLDSGISVPAARQYIQGALILLDTNEGGIRAMVGGRDYRQSEWNRSVQMARQPGSAFKPFVYLSAIESGLAPSDQVLDTPLIVKMRGQKDYKPKNHSGKFLGEITLRLALNKSINIPAVRLVQGLGTAPVIDTARRLGITSSLPNNLTLGLGSGSVSPLEITGAYGTLARGGIRSRPFAIVRVTDRWGHVLEEHQPDRKEVVTPQSAYIVTNMLETVIRHGTGIRARNMGFLRPSAGKTGTTDDNYDAWFVGYSPDYVCGVWVGFDERRNMGKWMEGSHASLPIWAEMMKFAHRDLPARAFEMPEGITKVVVCKDSGMLPTRYCPETEQEVFIEGREPTRACDRHSPKDAGWRGSGAEFREIDREISQEDEFGGP